MIRKIIEINQDKCNGCGLCVKACHEGAIRLVEGKARLVSDQYCDGLGDCLPVCPTDAIKIIEREAEPFDEEAVLKLKKEREEKQTLACGCPGTMARTLKRAESETEKKLVAFPSELRQWPVQLKLINTAAQDFEQADLLIAADCTAYAYANMHADFMKGRVTVIGCPKLDQADYTEKLAEIFMNHDIKSITVVKMEVPCCNGIVKTVKDAMLKTQTIVPYQEITVGVDGEVI